MDDTTQRNPIASNRSPVERKLALTTFPSSTITAGKLQSLSWTAVCSALRNAKERASKDACPLVKLGVFKGNSRASGSPLERMDAVIGDYDAGVMSVDEAVARLQAAGVRAAIYTSANHLVVGLPKYNGGPRWRVVAPLSASIGEDEHQPLVDLLNGALGGVLAPESWEWSRCYYFGRVKGVAYDFREVEGQPLDVVAACPDFEPIAPAVRPKPAVAPRAERRVEDINDPTVAWLDAKGLVTGVGHDGKVHVRCPWGDQHGPNDVASSTTWLPAGVGDFAQGHFSCRHQSHGRKTDGDFLEAVGYVADEFDADPAVSEAEAAEATAAAIRNAQKRAVSLEDFYAYGPDHKFIHRPTRALWPASSVDGMVHPWPTIKVPGKAKGEDGRTLFEHKPMAPSRWLDRHQAVQQMTWLPGAPEIIDGQIMLPSGWAPRPGARVYNRYLPPAPFVGDADQAGPWLDHMRALYPEDWQHLVSWFAHRLQRPGEKVNHALVLGGDQGIGKDSILVPIKVGVGASNVEDIAPAALMGGFNSFAASVLLVVSEARNLGEHDRFELYEQSKTYICAPPDVLRVNEKHLREYYVPNLCGVIFTTNHRTSGLYLPADDRRHFVVWSEANRAAFEGGYFSRLYNWYAAGGIGHVLAFLHSVDLTGFDPKAEPPRTAAFWAMVQAGEAPESSELRGVIEAMGSPDALTVSSLALQAAQLGLHDLSAELKDRKARNRLPHMLDRVDYVSVHNPDNARGKFGQETVYAKKALTFAAQVRAARALPAPAKELAGDGGANASDFA